MAYKKNYKRNGKNNKNYKNDGYRDKRSNDSKDDDRDKATSNERFPNDPRWYVSDPEVARQVTQLSFRNLAGLPLKLSEEVTIQIPNIMVNYLNPSAGVQTFTEDFESGLNMSSLTEFQQLSSGSGRTTTAYGPQDISLMNLALGECISQFECIRRALGCAFLFSERNRSFPTQVLTSMGLDAEDLYENYPNYRITFNRIVTQFNRIPIPTNVAYFDKCAALYEKIYWDDVSPMAQLVYNLPATTWILDETYDSNGSGLVTCDWGLHVTGGRNVTTLHSWLVQLQSCVHRLLSSSTLNVVYADIIRYTAAAGINHWKVDIFADGYPTPIEYNEIYLNQWHNMNFMGMPTHSTGPVEPLNITKYNDVCCSAEGNVVRYDPGFGVARSVLKDGVVVDFTTDNPDPLVVLDSLRFITIPSGIVIEGNTKYTTCATIPDHYGVLVGVFLPEKDPILLASTIPVDASTVDHLSYLSAFDWHPLFYVVKTVSGEYKLDGTINGDLNYYTTVDANYMTPITELIAFSLYGLRDALKKI